MRVTIYKRGQVWWGRWRKDGNQCRISFGTENRKIAEEARIRLEHRLLNGEEQPSQARVPVEELVEEYLLWSRANKRPRTVLNDQARIRGYLEFAQPAYVQDITTKNVMQFFAHRSLKDSVCATTILREREILHALMTFAIRYGYVESNPVSMVPRPKVPERDPRFLSLDQIDELLGVVDGDLIEPLMATAVYAGLRREELCWLTWSDLEEVGGRSMLRVRQKTIEGEFWIPKTKRSRSVPVSSKLEAHLRAAHRNGVPWLFPSSEGCRWDPDNLSRRLRGLMRKAGLPWNFLDLRHTFGSQLARKGTSLLKIAQLMGNSPEIARKHYIQLIPEEMAADVEF